MADDGSEDGRLGQKHNSAEKSPDDCMETEDMEVQSLGSHSQEGSQVRTNDPDYDEGGSEGNGEDVEEDEPEGLRKSLKKGYKAVKRFFTGSEQEKGADPESTYLAEAQWPSPQSSAPDAEEHDQYDFSHQKRGRAIVINNEKFHRYSALDNRPGSTKDAEAFKEVFKKLGFEVKCLTDLTALEIKQALEKEAYSYDHRNADCLAVAILSHGDSEILEKAWSHHHYKTQHKDKMRRDIIFGVDGTHISTASVIRTFQDERCPGLQGKPRLFFFQACRGSGYDDGMDVLVVPDGAAAPVNEADDDEVDEQEETDARGVHILRRKLTVSPAPIFKDFLVMYATTPGHFAWRRPSGTWFGQSFREVFMKQLTSHMSLTQALTRVIRLVALNFQSRSYSPRLEGKKQTPVIESMLTKDVFFCKK